MYRHVSAYMHTKSNREHRHVSPHGKYTTYERLNDESFLEINNVKCFANSCIEINALMYG